MPSNQQSKAAHTFLADHQRATGFIMPNAWDVGSALILEAEGFKAIGTTSGGIAFSLGKQDYQVGRADLAVAKEEMFSRMRQIVEAVDIPVNGDLESGYGETPEMVAQTITLAKEAGLAGGNIEDKKPFENALYDEAEAVERIAAAHEAGSAGGDSFVLTARTDVFRSDKLDTLNTVIRRANLFLEAGADCVFAPGIADSETIQTLVREINGPLNVVVGLTSTEGNAYDFIESGVQRISLGGTIARSALGYIRQCARDLKTNGNFDFPAAQISPADLNTLFNKSA